MRAPTKENTLVLIAVDIGGKNTQEKDQVRNWAAPTASPEISTMLGGILGRRGGLWLPARETTLDSIDSRKIFTLCFDLLCRFFWIFFSFFFLSFFTLSVVVVDVYGTMKSNLVLSLLFFFSVIFFIAVINLCLYVGLWQFCAISLSFNFLIFKPIIIFFTFITLLAFPTILFHLQLLFNVYKYLSISI